MPSFLDLPALATDVKAVQTPRDLAQGLNPVTNAINNSLMLSGSETYQGALVFYGYIKNAAKVKAPYAIAIYDDLSGCFPGVPAKKKA